MAVSAVAIKQLSFIVCSRSLFFTVVYMRHAHFENSSFAAVIVGTISSSRL